MQKKIGLGLTMLSLLISGTGLVAQNPLIRDQYTADPTARVFGNKVYIFPSHDILAEPGKGRPGWFCMEDYHVFSSDNLTNWYDHGVIVTQNNVPWVRKDSYSMWAPDCIYRNGKYYFYFPSMPADTLTHGRGFNIGVAISDKPEGPYAPEANPIKGVKGIDPNVFIDDDGRAYLYWSAGNIYGAKLKANMIELDSDVTTFSNLPETGLKEGPYVFKHKGIYYLTYPHVEHKTERLEYAMGDNPLGPFKVTGVIMDESSTGCWTNHHSLVEFRNQWYLFYHHNDYSPSFDKARSIRADSLFFNSDGTIRKVIPTLRGIGVTAAVDKIQLDRYSSKSARGAAIEFIDTLDRFQGWKTILTEPGAWMGYNAVRFETKASTLSVRLRSETGGTLVVKSVGASDKVIAEIPFTKCDWTTLKQPVKNTSKGTVNLRVELRTKGQAEIDWVSFK